MHSLIPQMFCNEAGCLACPLTPDRTSGNVNQQSRAESLRLKNLSLRYMYPPSCGRVSRSHLYSHEAHVKKLGKCHPADFVSHNVVFVVFVASFDKLKLDVIEQLFRAHRSCVQIDDYERTLRYSELGRTSLGTGSFEHALQARKSSTKEMREQAEIKFRFGQLSFLSPSFQRYLMP